MDVFNFIQSSNMAKILENWDPEDIQQWNSSGKAIAKRNLWISVAALVLAFVVWQIWSVIIVDLPEIGFKFTESQLFLLASLPALSGATLRIFYSFAVPVFGGRKWTVISTASLLIPLLGIGICIQDPQTSFSTMVFLALLCGFGGGNFSSSMANISLFFPQKEKGGALGINAGLGNLGVSLVQFVTPLVIAYSIFGAVAGDPQQVTKAAQSVLQWTQNAAYIWIPFVLAVTIAAWFGMNDVALTKTPVKEQLRIFKYKHNWLMCWLYIGTFGSFIGFSATFPMLTKTAFPEVDAVKYAFLGPFLGALTRVAGGMVSDKIAASKVTNISFIIMVAAVVGVIFALPHNGQAGNFPIYFVCFILLFVFSGIGNGSVFAQAPRVFSRLFLRQRQHMPPEKQHVMQQNAAKETATIVGFMGAIGAYGGFFIPKAFGSSLEATGSPIHALWGFIAFYVTCLLVNGWFYMRKSSPTAC